MAPDSRMPPDMPAETPTSEPVPSPFLEAARGGCPDRVPIWFQRQAGRSLPEYRAVRGEGTITEAINHGAVWKYLMKPWSGELLRQLVAEAFRHAEEGD